MNKALSHLLVPLLAATAFTLANPARASDGEAIVKKARCIACHTVDQKRVGPAYKDVATKYKGDGKAPGKLFDKVRAGGAGNWGEVPMLPHPADKISDDDLKAAIAWILGLS
ncbi:MAG: cytochrome [Proteobacteria bacterium]|nr:cytochrome [Pseudomonadota bacterium]